MYELSSVKLLSHEDDRETMRWDGEAKVAARKMRELWGRHDTGSTKYGNLAGCKVVGRPTHGIKGFEDIGVIVVNAPDFDRSSAGKMS
jgi:hypothetical protein